MLRSGFFLRNALGQVKIKVTGSDRDLDTAIHDLLATETFGGRKWPGEVLRLAMLMTHYREPIDFSVKRLEEAHAWRSMLRSIKSCTHYQSRRPVAKASHDLWRSCRRQSTTPATS